MGYKKSILLVMKIKSNLICLMLFLPAVNFAQNVGIGTQTPHASAMLDVSSTTKGLLAPRMTQQQRSDIQLPATGLIVFQTDGQSGLWVNKGLPELPGWVRFSDNASQEFSRTGNLVYNAAYFSDEGFIFGANKYPGNGGSQWSSLMLFQKFNGAFRVGTISSYSTVWSMSNIGDYSFAANFNNLAKGIGSTAMGAETQATGAWSIATGERTNANGNRSTAMGGYSTASGEFSTAMGQWTTAKAIGSMSIGLFNNLDDNPSSNLQSSDRIFQIGNGTSLLRNNAMTVLRNGNTGIGVLEPSFRLEVAGRMRIVSGGTGSTSAGIWLNKNDNNGLLGFIGVDGSNDIGIFNQTSGWSFLVRDATGNAWVKGTVTANGVTLTSDERLKKDITPLGNAMPLLEKLHGYQYHWKDETADTGLQTGLLAQEVEQVMPELVMTDEKGMKSVNYMGLIPYMLEAMKTQQNQIEELKILVEQLAKK
jgi:hypothetical protein